MFGSCFCKVNSGVCISVTDRRYIFVVLFVFVTEEDIQNFIHLVIPGQKRWKGLSRKLEGLACRCS